LDRFYSSFNPAEGSNSSRILIWKEGFTVLLKNPLGVGLGNFPLAVKPSAVYREPIYAHMLYLDIALETGLLGLIFWLLLIYSILRTFYLKSKDNPIYLAGFFSIIIFSSHSLVESPLFSIHILTLFLIISALGVKNIYMQKNA
jgi:O-antigen ligase